MKTLPAMQLLLWKTAVALLFILISVSSFAQHESRKKLRIGITGGFSNSTMKGTEVELYESSGATLHSKTSAVFGLIAKKDIWKNLVASIALDIMTKGGKYTNSSFYESPDKKATYLQMPILVGYNISPQSKVELHPEIGVALNYSISPYEYKPENYLNSASIKTPRFMASPVAGLTLNFKGNSVDFFVAVRYEFDNSKFFNRHYLEWNYYLTHSGTALASMGILLNTARRSK
jgi:hypothetical protein